MSRSLILGKTFKLGKLSNFRSSFSTVTNVITDNPVAGSKCLPLPLQIALATDKPINKWSKEQISDIYNLPLHDLTFYASLQHRKFHNPSEIQLCTLLSIKTGGCQEDCKYCSQSVHNDTNLKATKLLDLDTVYQKAVEAKKNGSTRFCMGSAWRDMVGRKSALKRISNMIEKINNELNLETCVTLGMINKEQAKVLKDSGLTAYNHNIDTSREHYKNIISTRSYDERLDTLKVINESNINVCTGGILGLGESAEDHIGFLFTLSNLDKHPESLPINKLVSIKGTRMHDELNTKYKDKILNFEDILRVIATARILMPESIVRLAAGRYKMKETEQLLAFLAGANAIFTGEKMLTTMCTGWEEDIKMLKKWGFVPMEAFKKTDPTEKLKVKINNDQTFEIELANSVKAEELKA